MADLLQPGGWSNRSELWLVTRTGGRASHNAVDGEAGIRAPAVVLGCANAMLAPAHRMDGAAR